MIHVSTAKMQDRKARLAEAPAGYCAGGQPQQSPPKWGTCLSAVRLRTNRSPAHLGSRQKEVKNKHGPSTSVPKPLEDGRPLQGPGKHKRSSGCIPDRRQAKRLTHTGQLSYARLVQWVCRWPPYVTSTQRCTFRRISLTSGGLADGLPEEGFTPSSSIPVQLKGLPPWYAKAKRPVTGWVAMYQL